MLDSPVKDLFRLLANCFMIICSDLAVLIFPTLFVDFQKVYEISNQIKTFCNTSYVYIINPICIGIVLYETAVMMLSLKIHSEQITSP